MAERPREPGSAPDDGGVVVSLIDWRRAHDPASRPFRPARVMSVGGGATDQFSNGSGLADLVTALLPVVTAGEPLGWLVVDGLGRVIAADLPAGLDVSSSKATEAALSALEEHGLARCDGERASAEFLVLADALLACRFVPLDCPFDITIVVAHREPRIANVVAALRTEDPSVLPPLGLRTLFAD